MGILNLGELKMSSIVTNTRVGNDGHAKADWTREG